MSYRDRLEKAIYRIASGLNRDEQIDYLIEHPEERRIQGWWPDPEIGKPYNSSHWSSLVIAIVKRQNEGKLSHSGILEKTARGWDTPVYLIIRFLREFGLWRAFKKKELTPEMAANAFEGSEQGRGKWAKGRAKDVLDKYIFKKSMGDYDEKK